MTPTLDSAACAELLNCSVTHLHRLARSGAIPGTKVGKGWVFVHDDILTWLRARARPKTAPRPAGRPRKRLVS